MSTRTTKRISYPPNELTPKSGVRPINPLLDDLAVSVTPSIISHEPFGRFNKSQAFVVGLFKFEPLLEVARTGLLYTLTSEQRELYLNRLVIKGESSDVCKIANFNLHSPPIEDESAEIPSDLQRKIAERLHHLYYAKKRFPSIDTDFSLLIFSGTVTAVGFAGAVLATELLHPGTYEKLMDVFRPDDPSHLFSAATFYFVINMLCVFALNRKQLRKISDDVRTLLESGKINDSSAREILYDVLKQEPK